MDDSDVKPLADAAHATEPQHLEPGIIVRRAREAAGLTLVQLADHIGCSKAHLSLMETGQRTISPERASRIEGALHITDSRVQRALRWASVPADMREAVDRSARLADDLRDALASRSPVASLRRLIDAHQDNISDVLPARRQIPIINKVAAGYPAEFTDLDYPTSIADEYVSCPDIDDPAAFAARVVGDSMEPTYKEGEIVVFSPSVPAKNGSDCFVRLERDNETTFKRVFYETQVSPGQPDDSDDHGPEAVMIRLQPLNAKYPPRVVTREHVTGIWPAAYVLRKV